MLKDAPKVPKTGGFFSLFLYFFFVFCPRQDKAVNNAQTTPQGVPLGMSCKNCREEKGYLDAAYRKLSQGKQDNRQQTGWGGDFSF